MSKPRSNCLELSLYFFIQKFYVGNVMLSIYYQRVKYGKYTFSFPVRNVSILSTNKSKLKLKMADQFKPRLFSCQVSWIRFRVYLCEYVLMNTFYTFHKLYCEMCVYDTVTRGHTNTISCSCWWLPILVEVSRTASRVQYHLWLWTTPFRALTLYISCEANEIVCR